jgi:Terminase RNaseH-like domain
MTGFFVGLDLGQAQDYTAIAVIEAVRPNHSEEKVLHVRHLERFRDRLYPDVADRVEILMETPELKDRSELVIDATGVGPAVTDIFKKRGRFFREVKIHGGDAESMADGVYRVPKRNLVSALQVALQSGTLKIAAGLDLAEVLRQELLDFRVKVSIETAHESYGAWREGDHDDLVLAVSLAVWSARTPQPTIIIV